MTTTVVALYDRLDDAHRAVQALEGAGVPRDAIGLVTGDRTAQAAGVGAAIGGAGGLLMGLSALAIPGIGPILAAGSVVTTLAGAGAGAVAGGMAGVLSGFGVPESEMRRYAEGVQGGGALLLVRAEDAMADRVRGILSPRARTGGTRRAAEEAARIEGGGAQTEENRGADWTTAGWAPFDQRPGPMTEVHREDGAPSGSTASGTGPAPDSTELGQPGSSPGTRGGATAFGGVERGRAPKKAT